MSKLVYHKSYDNVISVCSRLLTCYKRITRIHYNKRMVGRRYKRILCVPIYLYFYTTLVLIPIQLNGNDLLKVRRKNARRKENLVTYRRAP